MVQLQWHFPEAVKNCCGTFITCPYKPSCHSHTCLHNDFEKIYLEHEMNSACISFTQQQQQQRMRMLWIRESEKESPLGSLALINGTQREKEALMAPFYVFFRLQLFSLTEHCKRISDGFLLSIIFVDFMQSARLFKWNPHLGDGLRDISFKVVSRISLCLENSAIFCLRHHC